MNPSVEFKDVNPIEVNVPDINYIPAYKIAEEQRRANEEQRINNENERISYYNEIQAKVNNGEFKGDKGDKGEQGIQGIQGIQGVKGDKGDKGDKGEVGDTGYTLTNTASGESVTIDDSVEFKLIDLEIDGKSVQDGTPASNTPVEIKSVGYENLITKWTFGTVPSTSTGNDVSLASGGSSDYIKIDNKENHLLSFKSSFGESFSYYVIYYDSNKTFLGFKSFSSSKEYVETNVSDNNHYLSSNYIRIRIDLKSEYLSEQMLEKGTVKHGYVPFGKYGIEVETVGKNLFDKDNIEYGYTNYKTGAWVSSTSQTYVSTDYIKVDELKKYYSNYIYFGSSAVGISFYDNNKTFVSGISLPTDNIIAIPSGIKFMRIAVRVKDESITNIEEMYVINGTVATDYKQYQSNTSVIALNEPLRSLPNGVKDTFENGVITRRVGRILLDGNENWSGTENYYTSVLKDLVANSYEQHLGLSNYYQVTSEGFKTYDNLYFDDNNNLCMYDPRGEIYGGLEWWIDFLKSTNVEVIYELATPVTETVEMPVINTYEGINNINISGGLSTTVNIKYAQDMGKILEEYTTEEEVQNMINEALGLINTELASLTEVSE